MAGEFLLPTLALTTMALVIAFAIWSKHRTEKKIEADDDKKSSLAKDGPGPQPFR